MNSVNLTLKQVREQTGMSQEDYARKLNIRYGTYVKKELYLRGLTARELIAISDFSGIPVRNIALKK